MYLNKNGIETLRLRTRKLVQDDILLWQKFFISNPSLEYLGFNLSFDNYTLSKDWIQSQFDRYKTNRYGHQALINKTTNNFIGQCGLLTQTINNEDLIEIGYHILPEFWGQGFATEAAIGFRDFAFQQKISKKLVSIIDERNIASQNVAKKNGMLPMKKTKYHNLNVIIYEITHQQWLKLKEAV